MTTVLTTTTESSKPNVSQKTMASTLRTTPRTPELITATLSSHEVPTSYHFGPAITAPPLPTPEPTGGLSPGSRDTVIATTTIGGVLILAFLIYAIWRRRKGATPREIVYFRPHSSAQIFSPGPRKPEFTALPIYRESRYSVQSTKRGSWLSFSKLMQRRAPSPSSEAFSRGLWLHAQWKLANPPTPTRTGHPLSQVESSQTSPLRAPEMAHSRPVGHTERIRIKRAASDGNTVKPGPTVSSQEVPSTPVEAVEESSRPGTPDSSVQLQDDSRWSWTNSQAPATPRMRTRSPTRRPSRASTGSLPSFRRVHSWLRPQHERAVNRIPEEQAAKPVPKQKLPPLKNKASKPVLAPISTAKPGRRLSKKSGPPSVDRSRSKSVGTRGGDEHSTPGAASFSLPLQRN